MAHPTHPFSFPFGRRAFAVSLLLSFSIAGRGAEAPPAGGGESACLPRVEAGQAYYYDTFSAQGRPWKPPVERNFEEVYQRYEYFEVHYADGGRRLKVRRYQRGRPDPVQEYALGPDCALRPVSAGAGPRPETLYARHCASCHGDDRIGFSGPALLPESLARLGVKRTARVIREGLPATQMPGFAGVLSDEEIQALARFLHEPPEREPTWTEADIRNTHRQLVDPRPLSETPVFEADPLNVFLVVEKGDHHITVLDGDRFEPIHRFKTHYALHGGPKFSPDGRIVYMASRDGWISRFDLYNLKTTAEIRVALNTRNLAVSPDGRYVLVGNTLPRTLVLLDASDLSLVQVIPVVSESGARSRVSAVYQAAPRGSFIVALKDIPEIWELRVQNRKARIRRIPVGAPLDDFFFDQPYRHLIGANREAETGEVIDLDTGRKVAELELPGMPHLGSGIIWEVDGRPVFATPHLKEGKVSVIDMRDWKVVKRIDTLGPGFFMRSHENSPHAWVDVFFGPNKDVMHVIDKQKLEVVATLRPEPGKVAAHVEFDRYGRHALVSIWDEDGAIVVYDDRTLKEIKRLPMKKPSGKYNVHNKITRSAGTSH
jgi:mono/diheme cytochrome c family protein/WD40 repeat protein